ncbi:MAG TPA: ABC transporter ATP-binding protein [Thermoanaerobacterales bacterium]|jgi:branched-chain amino acid transport system ATP-binding protein|nr:ABC transporter ATP-binding protein [Thermoanaerobacterales bacterium]
MKPILRGESITQKFGGLVANSDVNFELYKNEIVGIIGPNGAGKTTLFNIITGMFGPTSGKIYYKDEDITGLKPYDIAKKGIARTFQNIRLFKNMMVIDNVITGLHTQTKTSIIEAVFNLPRNRMENKESITKAEEILKKTGLYEYRYHYANSLAYGLQRRLEIARAMAVNTEVLLLDEPAAGMNENETSELLEFILELKGFGFTILLIEHDMRLVMNLCERIYVLDHGMLIASGKPAEIKSNPLVIDAYLGKGV